MDKTDLPGMPWQAAWVHAPAAGFRITRHSECYFEWMRQVDRHDLQVISTFASHASVALRMQELY
jgi:hypothetical protein